MDLLNKKTGHNKLLYIIALTLIIIFCLFLLIRCMGIRITTNAVVLFIDNKSTTTYKINKLASPGTFKSIPIKTDENIGLGYAVFENETYYCIYGTLEYTDNFIVKYAPPDRPLLREEHRIKMKAEIVFKEEDIREGGAIEAHVYVFYDGHSFPAAWVDAEIKIDKVYSSSIRYTITEETILDYPFLDYTDARFDSKGVQLIRSCFDAFNSFLVINDFKEFHRK